MSLRERKRDRIHQSQRRSRKQESELAKRLGGRTTKGSGSGVDKGDVVVPGLVRIEAKTTQARSYSITVDTIAHIEAACLRGAEVPFMEIEFCSQNGKPYKRIGIVPMDVLEAIMSLKDKV